MLDKPTGRLEEWFKSTTMDGYILYGRVYDDQRNRFNDGDFIHTSLVTDDTFSEGSVVNTLYSTYLLGTQRIRESD